MHANDLPTPALIVDAAALDHNLRTMAEALPGPRMRPHVKAHKTSALARRQAEAGHRSFTAATIRECEVLAAAGLGDDILLANEVLDTARLRGLDVTVAVDSEATIDAAAGNVARVLIDVNVGLPRCGCAPDEAGRLADYARSRHLDVRGVMGYEGHVVGLADRAAREAQTAECMERLLAAHKDVGGDVVSAGGTGTYDINTWANEIQAGSYALMDTAYGHLDLPFKQALFVTASVISANPQGYAVANAGLKAFGMDHGNPIVAEPADADTGAAIWFLSDEHVTFSADPLPKVGDRIKLVPAHVDPTVAYHERMHVVDADGYVVESWDVDMRNW